MWRAAGGGVEEGWMLRENVSKYVEGRCWMWRKCGCGGRLKVEDGWWC